MSLVNEPDKISPEKIFKISEINRLAKNLLQSHLPKLWISGEVSNFIEATSGHWYFSLKDSQAQIKCTMFRGHNQFASIKPKNGDLIEAFGSVSIYEARGDYQINLEQLREAGTGDLFEKFVELKNKLENAGYFKDINKKKIPLFPKNIGIISSSTGAALQDVLSIFEKTRKYHGVIIYPSVVQGKEAAKQLCKALQVANQRNEVDLIILCRGGGSIEDLWPFNEEELVFEIAKSKLPVISGVGHETDFTLCDFVSDVRAPTPTGAAAMAVENIGKIDEYITYYRLAMKKILKNIMSNNEQKLDFLEKRLISPKEKLIYHTNNLTKISKLLKHKINIKLIDIQKQIVTLQKRIQPPTKILKQNELQLIRFLKSLQLNLKKYFNEKQTQLKSQHEKIEILSPKNIMAKGYSIVYNNGKLIKNFSDVQLNDTIDIHLHLGRILGEVKDTKKT